MLNGLGADRGEPRAAVRTWEDSEALPDSISAAAAAPGPKAETTTAAETKAATDLENHPRFGRGLIPL